MESEIRFKTESSLAQQCFEQLQNEIIDGILKPGEKLKVDPIKERFDIGPDRCVGAELLVLA